MTFILARRPVAAAPVEFSFYDIDGKLVTTSFVAQYERHSSEQVFDLQDGLTNRARKAQNLPPIARPDGSAVPEFACGSDIDFIKAKLVGWLEVTDESGAAVPFSAEVLEQQLQAYPEIVGPLFSGFFAAHREAQRKN